MSKEIISYRDLIVWQKGMALSHVVEDFCRDRLKPGTYGLLDQLQRAADSIPANIAEGYGRFSRKDYLRFVSIANGSLKELETRLLQVRTRFPNAEAEVDRILESSTEVGRILFGLIRALRLPKKP